VSLISKYPIGSYNVTYLRRPNPIILEDIERGSNTLKIDGKGEKNECELNPALHRIILENAVQLALQSVSMTNNNSNNNNKNN